VQARADGEPGPSAAVSMAPEDEPGDLDSTCPVFVRIGLTSG
jgi:hypothetical protein